MIELIKYICVEVINGRDLFIKDYLLFFIRKWCLLCYVLSFLLVNIKCYVRFVIN